MTDQDAAEEKTKDEQLAEERARFNEFLAENPQSTIDWLETNDGERLAIQSPWADPSIAIFIPEDADVLADAVNAIYLPENFSAVWHRDTKKFEVIWTAHPIPRQIEDIRDREFELSYNRKEYKCSFAPSSERLLTLAENSQPISGSRTGHRNLQSFYSYARYKKPHTEGEESPPRPRSGDPLSFWIEGLDWNEEEVLEVAAHINFYMSYYDTFTPAIIIHTSDRHEVEPQTRYRSGKFPKKIISRTLDENLLHFWSACQEGDPARRFIYCYRILEYAASLYLENTVQQQIRKTLLAPDALDNLNQTTERFIEIFESRNAQLDAKIVALLKGTVNPKLLWREIQLNIDSFTKKTIFDGGLLLAPMIPEGLNEEQFDAQGLQSFSKSIREIRNALSHGREQRSLAVITPTKSNFERLRPWVSAFSIVAGEVILYRAALQ